MSIAEGRHGGTKEANKSGSGTGRQRRGLTVAMSKMFESVDDTWNVVKGCRYGCSWCWARACAEARLKHNPRYRDGFEPAFFPGDLERRFKPGQFVLVAEMATFSESGFLVPGLPRCSQPFGLIREQISS